MLQQNEAVLNLAKKLKELADRGVDGEKLNAKAKLSQMMKKYNLTETDLENEVVKPHEFTLGPGRLKFFIQIVVNVIGRKNELRRYPKSNKFILICTDIEWIEVKIKYDFFWKVFKKEQEYFYAAFIQRNELFTKESDEEKMARMVEQTPEQRAEARKILRMAESLDQHTYRKQLSNR